MGKRMGEEASFQSAVIAVARLHGWKVAHFRKARTKRGWVTAVSADGQGWPDLLLCHPQRGLILARELKVPPNTTTPEQETWLCVLRACGVDARVWTPTDWVEIQRTLSPP